MTKTKVETIITRLGDRLRDEVLRRYRSNCCIATARVASRVLERFNVEARVIPVSLAVFNHRFVEACERAGAPPLDDPVKFAEWCAKTGAYSVGAAPADQMPFLGPGAKGFNGHVIVYVPRTETLIDGSIEQVNRPQHGIVLPGAVAIKLGRRGPDLLAYLPVVCPVNRCSVVYKRIDDFSFQRSPDWNQAIRTDEIVRRLVRAVKG